MTTQSQGTEAGRDLEGPEVVIAGPYMDYEEWVRAIAFIKGSDEDADREKLLAMLDSPERLAILPVSALEALRQERDEASRAHQQTMAVAAQEAAAHGRTEARARAAEERARRVETALRELLDGIGIEFDDERLNYMTVQVNRIDWQAAERVLLTPTEASGHDE